MPSQSLKALKTGTLLSAINLLLQAVSFIGVNLMAHNLGAETFGALGVLQNDLMLFMLLADFGTSTAIISFWKKDAASPRLLARLLQLRLILSGTGVLLFILFALTIRGQHSVMRAECIVALSLLLHQGFFDWLFIGQQRWKTMLGSKLLHSLSYVIVMGFALLYLRVKTLEGIACAMLAAGLPAWLFGVRSLRWDLVPQWRKSTLRFFKIILAKSVPLGLSGILSMAFLPLSLYMLDWTLPQNPLIGAFNTSFKLMMIASGIMAQFITSHTVVRTENRYAAVSLKGTLLFSILSTLLVTIIWWQAENMLQLLFFGFPWEHRLLAYSTWILRCLSLSLVIQALRTPLIASLLSQRKTWTWLFYLAIAACINVCAAWLASFCKQPQYSIPCAVLLGDGALTLILWLKNSQQEKKA